MIFNLAITLLFGSLSTFAIPQTVSRSDGSQIQYELRTPASDQAEHWPLLVVLQGSGCEPVNSTGFASYLSIFHSLGFGVLTVEKPGIYGSNLASGCSQEYLIRNTISQRIEDLQTVIARVREEHIFQEHWNGSLMWLGASEGGTVASMIAPLFSETTATALLASGGGVPMAEELKILTAKSMRNQGKTETEVSQALAQMDSQFEEIRANPVSDQTWLGSTNTYKWWASILDLDIKSSLEKLTSSVYIAQATADQSVPVESVDILLEGKSLSPFGPWTYARYEGLDHRFQDANGNSQRDTVLSNVLLWFMVREDQRLRFRSNDIYRSNPNDPRLPDLIRKISERDRLNLAFLKMLCTNHQYPLISSHGFAANRHAWILIQHADSDPLFQREVLSFLEAAYTQNQDTFGPDLAYLKDRVAVNEALQAEQEPVQYFGTQGRRASSGCWEPWTIQDREHVDERRRAYGMGSLAEYTRTMNEVIGGSECNRALEGKK